MSVNTICPELMEMAKNSSFDFHLDPVECVCGDLTSSALIETTYKFDGKFIIVKNVPVLKCNQCGELYSDALIQIRVEQQAYKALQEGRETIDFNE